VEDGQWHQRLPRSCASDVIWKHIDLIQDVLSVRDVAQVQAAGTISITAWIDKVKSGDPTV